MFKFALVLVIMLGLSGVSFSAPVENKTPAGPEIITFQMGGKPFEFKHWSHQKNNNSNGGCTNCHRDEVGKINGWGQEFAHMICIPCHDLNDKGPTSCKECHKK